MRFLVHINERLATAEESLAAVQRAATDASAALDALRWKEGITSRTLNAARSALAETQFTAARAERTRDEPRATAALASENKATLSRLDTACAAASEAAEAVVAAFLPALEGIGAPLALALSKSAAAREAFSTVAVVARSEPQLQAPTTLVDGLEGSSLLTVAKHLLQVLAARDFAASMTAAAPPEHNWTPNAGRPLPTEWKRGIKPVLRVDTREMDLTMSRDPETAEIGRELQRAGK